MHFPVRRIGMISIQLGIMSVIYFLTIDPVLTFYQSFPFGWEDAADGFRGHVFRSSDNGTVILSIKGTTLNGPTSKKDKFNDNLLFSCCCARVDIRWALHTVCDCYSGRNKCDATCLSGAMIEDSLFYSIGVVCQDLLHRFGNDADRSTRPW
jgi:lipase ATG15